MHFITSRLSFNSGTNFDSIFGMLELPEKQKIEKKQNKTIPNSRNGKGVKLKRFKKK